MPARKPRKSAQEPRTEPKEKKVGKRYIKKGMPGYVRPKYTYVKKNQKPVVVIQQEEEPLFSYPFEWFIKQNDVLVYNGFVHVPNSSPIIVSVEETLKKINPITSVELSSDISMGNAAGRVWAADWERANNNNNGDVFALSAPFNAQVIHFHDENYRTSGTIQIWMCSKQHSLSLSHLFNIVMENSFALDLKWFQSPIVSVPDKCMQLIGFLLVLTSTNELLVLAVPSLPKEMKNQNVLLKPVWQSQLSIKCNSLLWKNKQTLCACSIDGKALFFDFSQQINPIRIISIGENDMKIAFSKANSDFFAAVTRTASLLLYGNINTIASMQQRKLFKRGNRALIWLTNSQIIIGNDQGCLIVIGTKQALGTFYLFKSVVWGFCETENKLYGCSEDGTIKGVPKAKFFSKKFQQHTIELKLNPSTQSPYYVFSDTTSTIQLKEIPRTTVLESANHSCAWNCISSHSGLVVAGNASGIFIVFREK